MVDSIKSRTNQTQPIKVTNQTDHTSLRENLKNLSSGLSVAQVMRDAPTVVHLQNSQNTGQVGKVVQNLKEAVNSSKETLKSLEDLVASFDSSGEAAVKTTFAIDVQKLRSNIVDLLDTLHKQAGTAEVMSENIQAADVSLEDVEKARAAADEMQSTIKLDNTQALAAHSGLRPERVSALLAD